MAEINLKETYVEGFGHGLRFVIDGDIKDGQMVVVIQGKQKKVKIDGEDAIDFNLSWLPADEAAKKYGAFILEMVKLAEGLTKAVCGGCGKTLAKEQLKRFDGGNTCEKCLNRKISWEIDYNETVIENRKNAGLPPSEFIKWPANKVHA